MNLGPGTYAYYCTVGTDEGKGHWKSGQLGTFTVTGTARAKPLPAAPASLTLAEYSINTAGLKAGLNTVRVADTGTQKHQAIIFPIAAGKTLDDVKSLFSSQAPPSGPPPVDFARTRGIAVLEGGFSYVTQVTLEVGRYAFVCFLTDTGGGAPHFAKGMIAEVTVRV